MMPSGYVSSNFVTNLLSANTASRKSWKRGKEITAVPAECAQDVAFFSAYLREKENLNIKVTRKNTVTGEIKELTFPYVHRWTEIYKRRVLAKFYILENRLGNDVPATMLTLTCRTANITREECNYKLRDGRKNLFDKMRKLGLKCPRFWVMEPHKSGYSHCHVLYFGTISEDIKNKLKLAWSCVYGIGDFKHGLDITSPRSSSDGSFSSGSVSRVRGYAMKYIAKNLNPSEMSPKEFVFNTYLKKTKTRLWGASRDLTSYIKQEMERYRSITYGEPVDKNVWEFIGASVCDNEGNVVSDIPKKFKTPEMVRIETKIYSVAASSNWFIEKIQHLINLGLRSLKPAPNNMLDVFEVVTKFA